MMTADESRPFSAVCAGRDKLSERFEAMEDARNFWRGLAIILLSLAALEVLARWAGWTL